MVSEKLQVKHDSQLVDILPVTSIHKGKNWSQINNHHYFLFSANNSESVALLLTIAACQCRRWPVLYYVHCNVDRTCYSLFCMARFLWGENFTGASKSRKSSGESWKGLRFILNDYPCGPIQCTEQGEDTAGINRHEHIEKLHSQMPAVSLGQLDYMPHIPAFRLTFCNSQWCPEIGPISPLFVFWTFKRHGPDPANGHISCPTPKS